MAETMEQSLGRNAATMASERLVQARQLEQEFYAAQFKLLDAEALYTLIAAVVITVIFWLSIYLSYDYHHNLFAMPLWFVLSCLGGYIVSVIGVIILVTCFLRHCKLNVPRIGDLEDASIPETLLKANIQSYQEAAATKVKAIAKAKATTTTTQS